MKKSLIVTLLCVATVALYGCNNTEEQVADVPVQECEPVCETAESSEIPETEAEETEAAEVVKASNWSTIITSKLEQKAFAEGFLNENYGLTVGYEGVICYTNDGSQTWEPASNESWCRYCLDIVDDTLAWSGGNGNQVNYSTDSGKTWTRVSDIDLEGMHSNITFVDDTTGWVSSNTKLAGTTDGGQTWVEMTLPEGAKTIASIELRTTTDGYLLTHNGALFVTADAGATWTQTAFTLDGLGFVGNMLPKIDTALADMHFTDALNGMVVLSGNCSGTGPTAYCLTTQDGGNTWSSDEIPLEEGFSPSYVFLSPDCKLVTFGSSTNNSICVISNNVE